MRQQNCEKKLHPKKARKNNTGRLTICSANVNSCNSVQLNNYCAPVWTRSPDTKVVDVKLRESTRTLGGCLESTPIRWLPTISSIAAPHIRREDETQKIIKTIEDVADNIPFKQILQGNSNNKKTKVKKPLLQCKDRKL
ncbi:RNA-directed DNA polymerase from mobile element jockey-like [Elysia marginata]|uniref:RNA-directed DNA polymerase from mobile element jockey-like n=1 Tax=Elysia marginata TaxID=1093978 RepID=A0AAV4H2B3_9GAST|nr:RNA-directed DNA polymerase from mobile element jockey-like [Elysia marginata]